MKYKISKIENDLATLEVLRENEVILTRTFPIDLDFDLTNIRQKLKQDAQTFLVKQEEEKRKKDKGKDLEKLIGQEFDL